MSEDASQNPQRKESTISSYFQHDTTSIFDQLSPNPTNVDQNSTTNTNTEPNKDLQLGVESCMQSLSVSSHQEIGFENPSFSQDSNNVLLPQSPQPAVLTPGVTQPNSQASTPFKEIDPAQAALLSAHKETKENILVKESQPLHTRKTEMSPNTSVDLESTVVKFSQISVAEDVSKTINENTVKYSPVPPRSLPTTSPQTFPYDSTEKSNVSDYFNSSKSPFEISRALNQSSTSLSDSAMMNPLYMSPTENFNISCAIPSPDSFLTPATEQDVFTASLLSSDADRRHDAWLPSVSTKKALQTMASSPPGTYFPEKDLLTMPGIAVKEDFGDPVKNLVRSYLGEEASLKRQVLTSSSVTQDDRGVRQLIANGCYHAAVNLTTLLLTVYGQGEGRAGHPSKHTAHSIQLWFTRIALLVKLRRFSLAEVECQYFGDLDAPDLYFQFYPELYGGRKGSMVPFSFRLLVAELPQYLGKHTQALDKLNRLLRTCEIIISNLTNGLGEDGTTIEMTTAMREDSLKLWRARRIKVLYSITSCAVAIKDFRLAGGLIHKLLEEDLSSTAGLYSALGRLCLQLGDINAAQEAFIRYLEYAAAPPHHDPVQGLLHSAYIAIAQSNYQYAMEILQQAYKINPTNALVLNNLGVCMMYIGQVRSAMQLIESAVVAQPERFLHEAIVLNLATLYELETSRAHDNKLKILSLISQYKGDSFNVAALKLQPQ